MPAAGYVPPCSPDERSDIRVSSCELRSSPRGHLRCAEPLLEREERPPAQVFKLLRGGLKLVHRHRNRIGLEHRAACEKCAQSERARRTAKLMHGPAVPCMI